MGETTRSNTENGAKHAAFSRFGGVASAFLVAALICNPLSYPTTRAEALSLPEAESLRASGQLRSAEEAFRALIESGDARQKAVSGYGLGNVQLQQLRRAEAEKTLRSARSQSERLELGSLTAAIDNSLGMLFDAQGRTEEARRAYTDSRRGALAAGDAALAASALVNQARSDGDPAARASALSQSLTEVRALPDSAVETKGNLLLAIASALCPPRSSACPAKSRENALSALDDVRRIGVADPRLLSQALGQTGGIFEGDGRDTEALEQTRRAIVALPERDHDLMLQWEWQRGRLLRRQPGGEVEAARAYRRSIHHIEAIRLDIPVEYADGRSSFRETLEPIYLSLADLLLRQAQRSADPAQRASLLREARDAVERIKVAEFNDYFQDQCINPLERSRSLEGIDPRIAVLYPIALPDRLELILSNRQEIRQFVVPVKRRKLEAVVSAFRRNLESPEHNRFIEQAKVLNDWVVRPIESLLAEWSVDTLVVAPDGALRTIPFTALFDGNHFLIERFAVVTSPGLGLTDARPVEWGNGQMLLAGLSDAVQGFTPLPAVPLELSAIKEKTRGVALLNQAYVQAELENKFSSAQFVAAHFATHGRFTGRPSENFLLTYDDKLDMQRLESLISHAGGPDRPLELLTLSACQTAQGDDRAVLGLAGLAVKAGARSAVATLWLVDDEAAATAMVGFYQQLLNNKGLSKAKALRRAQLALLDQDRFWHPAYWAPFLLIGNWL